MNLNRMDRKILALCREDQSYADDDRKLIARIWKQEGFHEVFILKGLYEALKHVSDAQYIKRQRRNLQNLGLITPSEKVVEKRYTQFKEERDERGNSHAIKKNIEKHYAELDIVGAGKKQGTLDEDANRYLKGTWAEQFIQTSMLGDK